MCSAIIQKYLSKGTLVELQGRIGVNAYTMIREWPLSKRFQRNTITIIYFVSRYIDTHINQSIQNPMSTYNSNRFFIFLCQKA